MRFKKINRRKYQWDFGQLQVSAKFRHQDNKVVRPKLKEISLFLKTFKHREARRVKRRKIR